MKTPTAQVNDSFCKKWFRFLYSNFVCIKVSCLHVCMCTVGIWHPWRSEEGALEMLLCMVGSHHVGAKNQSVSSVRAANTPNLCQNCTCRGLLCGYEEERR